MSGLFEEKIKINYKRIESKIARKKREELNRWRERADYDGHIFFKNNEN